MASLWSGGSASSRLRASSLCSASCPPPRDGNTTTWPAHLRGVGRDLRRAPGTRGHRRVGGVWGCQGDRRAGGQRGGRHLLAGQPAAGASGHPRQELVRSYSEEVVHKEWPLMEQGRAPLLVQERGIPVGWTIIDDIL